MKPSRLKLGTVIILAALLPRVAWISYSWSQRGSSLEFPDEELHWQLATNLVNEGTLVSDDGRYAARMPAYPLFLATCAWLGSTGILAARLAQALLGAATALLAYLLVERACGRRSAVIAGLLVCLDPYAVFFSNLLLTEVLFGLFALALTACAWPLVTRRTQALWATAFGLAVLGAAALMTRPSAAGWILALWVIVWLREPSCPLAWARLALCVAVMSVFLVPWGLRNRAVIGAPAWLSTNGGVTLYDAVGPQADGSSDQTFLTKLPQLAGLDEAARDQKLRQMAFAQIREEPARVLSLAWVKFLRTWSLVPNVPKYRLGLTAAASAVFTIAVLVGALAGLVQNLRLKNGTSATVRDRRRLHLLLWLPVVYFTLVHCLFVGSLRYRVPLMPFLEIAAATAFVQTRRCETRASSPRS